MLNEKQRCEDCKNEDLCKWCSEMKRNQEEVSKIPVCKGLTPITISVECKSFTRKAQSYDGFQPNFR